MKRTNKGFTIVEVVISVVIAVFVSVAAMSVIIATRSSTKQAEEKHNVTSQVAAILECYKSSSDNKDFENALEFAYNKKLNGLDTAKSSYDLYIFFSKDGSVASKNTSKDGYTGKYEYFVRVNIKCKTAGDFKDSEFNAAAYENMPAGTDLSTVEHLIIYKLDNKFVKGGGAA